jgi:hypothetical protein
MPGWVIDTSRHLTSPFSKASTMVSRSPGAVVTLALAVLAVASCLPGVFGQSTYTGPICGDVQSDTCPGKPYAGSSFTGAFCGFCALLFFFDSNRGELTLRPPS